MLQPEALPEFDHAILLLSEVPKVFSVHLFSEAAAHRRSAKEVIFTIFQNLQEKTYIGGSF